MTMFSLALSATTISSRINMRELCGQMNLSFFLVNDTWVNEFRRKLEDREIAVRVMLDLTANQTIDDDPYLLVAKEVKRQRGHVIHDPDLTAYSAHKARFHEMLVQNEILVPETIMVGRNELNSFKITQEIKDRVGVPFVVKPAWGDSGVGVVVDAQCEDALHWSAEQTPNSDTSLIQKRLQPVELGNHMGWFRMVHLCREVIPCWWKPGQPQISVDNPGPDTKLQAGPLTEHHAGHRRNIEDEKVHLGDLSASGR